MHRQSPLIFQGPLGDQIHQRRDTSHPPEDRHPGKFCKERKAREWGQRGAFASTSCIIGDCFRGIHRREGRGGFVAISLGWLRWLMSVQHLQMLDSRGDSRHHFRHSLSWVKPKEWPALLSRLRFSAHLDRLSHRIVTWHRPSLSPSLPPSLPPSHLCVHAWKANKNNQRYASKGTGQSSGPGRCEGAYTSYLRFPSIMNATCLGIGPLRRTLATTARKALLPSLLNQ